MNVNNYSYGVKGQALTKQQEGFSLKVYLDQHGIPTNGWGHTGKEVHIGMPDITLAQAQSNFVHDTAWAVAAVNNYVKVKLTKNQFDALVDFVYNEGAEAFHGSTLLVLLNQGKYAQASDQFSHWNKIKIKGVYTVSKGLVSRRAAEVTLFNTP